MALTALTITALGAGWTTLSAQPASPPVAAARPGLVAGYLSRGGAPSSLALVPPPPTAGSSAQARDDDGAKAAVALHGTPRWDLATQDADLSFPNAAGTFSCALGVPVTEAATPKLYQLLRRTLADFGLSTYPTKTKYQRARPFTVNGAPMCTPALDAGLRKDGSYPSGHAAIGWGWALVVAEVDPERAEAILARGRAFSESRMICNVHWASDVEEGRTMASATAAKLHAQAEFRADVEAARAEVAAVRAQGLAPNRDCAKEAAQLAR
ncbi:MAG: phosphatase PAP2 family protein [Alphaproteobacteria bacterium]|nr:phosphatase PAP2 family protein [Alphaproteobacteria bacterium]MBU1514519.1 phosphatase PAP2 family protein [Alphaproteobacteria bacterium]MBU2096849.1 phosphatase PAP2 family protein [Alphaproteobacteria bacterium]MBU2153476.1 phosphatase PAP2 family protein [Alphaproteobacteria bacterium]MBU2306019.1 phosphatase PAP2 family protein [Alphaproteobacteria bacterium]